MNPGRVLCVDDEPRVLEGLQRSLGESCNVFTAEGGEAALAYLDAGEKFEVVISDMRMPRMNGAALLAHFRQRAPDTVRILLTGQSEIEAAIAAVNEGQIFRFLSKPCPPESLMAAVTAASAQHRLITSERVLLEQTLVGSIRALIEVLALTHAEAFGPSMRQHERARLLAERLGVPDPWHVEVASMLASIGYVVLPPDVLAKVNGGKPLTAQEQRMLGQVPRVAEKVVAQIPRLDRVEELLGFQGSWLGKSPVEARKGPALPLAAQILRALYELGVLEYEKGSPREALAALREREALHSVALLEAVSEVCALGAPKIQALPLSEVRPGMVFAEDVMLEGGPLLVARGQRVTERVLLRLTNQYARRIKEPVLCEVE